MDRAIHWRGGSRSSVGRVAQVPFRSETGSLSKVVQGPRLPASLTACSGLPPRKTVTGRTRDSDGSIFSSEQGPGRDLVQETGEQAARLAE